MKINISTGRAGRFRNLVVKDRATGTAKLSLDLQGDCWTIVTGSGEVADRYRAAGALCVQQFEKLGEKKVYIDIPVAQEPQLPFLLQGIVAMAVDTTWTMKPKESESQPGMHLILPARKSVRALVDKSLQILRSLQWTIDMVQAPANHLGPQQWASLVADRLGARCKVTVRDRAWLRQEGFGLMNAVGQAGREPALMHVQYRPPNAVPDNAPILLVGKGITFDSGGLDLKPPAGMRKMKYDMAGGAAVAGVMDYVSSIGLQVGVDAIIAAADNLVGAGAMMPGDVYQAHNGLSVEIDNTDAEGRLVLADALHWGCEIFQPSMVVSVATLTGAAVSVAGWHPVVTGTSSSLVRNLERAGKGNGEKLVSLPLWEEFGNELSSDVADLKNATGTRRAGTLSAAAFLSRFVPIARWGHLDIAASAWNDGAHPYFKAGPTGAGFRCLAAWLESLAA